MRLAVGRRATPRVARARRARATTRAATTRDVALALLDRDGVINVDVGAPGVVDVAQFELIDGAARAVRALNDAGVPTAVVTNQTAIGKGYVSAAYVEDVVHGEMRRALREDAGATLGEIYYAHKARDEPCDRRKPAPGMVVEALAANGLADEPSRAVFVGDTVTDMQAAARAGVRRCLVCTGYGEVMGEALRSKNQRLPYRITTRADDPTMSLPDECFPVDVYEDLAHAVCCLLAVPSFT